MLKLTFLLEMRSLMEDITELNRTWNKVLNYLNVISVPRDALPCEHSIFINSCTEDQRWIPQAMTSPALLLRSLRQISARTSPCKLCEFDCSLDVLQC